MLRSISAIFVGLLALSQPLMANEGIVPNEEGWWSTGVMVGTISGKGWEDTFFRNSGTFSFLAGAGDPKYPPIVYKVYVEPEYKEGLWNQVNSAETPVVIEYIYVQYSGSEAVAQDADDTLSNPVIHGIHIFNE